MHVYNTKKLKLQERHAINDFSRFDEWISSHHHFLSLFYIVGVLEKAQEK